MKTYTITKDSEEIQDKGNYYILNQNYFDGNVHIILDKPVIVEGDQRVKGDQIVDGDQRVEGDQIVEGYQIVKE